MLDRHHKSRIKGGKRRRGAAGPNLNAPPQKRRKGRGATNGHSFASQPRTFFSLFRIETITTYFKSLVDWSLPRAFWSGHVGQSHIPIQVLEPILEERPPVLVPTALPSCQKEKSNLVGQSTTSSSAYPEARFSSANLPLLNTTAGKEYAPDGLVRSDLHSQRHALQSPEPKAVRTRSQHQSLQARHRNRSQTAKQPLQERKSSRRLQRLPPVESPGDTARLAGLVSQGTGPGASPKVLTEPQSGTPPKAGLQDEVLQPGGSHQSPGDCSQRDRYPSPSSSALRQMRIHEKRSPLNSPLPIRRPLKVINRKPMRLLVPLVPPDPADRPAQPVAANGICPPTPVSFPHSAPAPAPSTSANLSLRSQPGVPAGDRESIPPVPGPQQGPLADQGKTCGTGSPGTGTDEAIRVRHRPAVESPAEEAVPLQTSRGAPSLEPRGLGRQVGSIAVGRHANRVAEASQQAAVAPPVRASVCLLQPDLLLPQVPAESAHVTSHVDRTSIHMDHMSAPAEAGCMPPDLSSTAKRKPRQVSFQLPFPNKGKEGPSPHVQRPRVSPHKSGSPKAVLVMPGSPGVSRGLFMGEIPLVFTPPPHLTRLRLQSIAARHAGHLNTLTVRSPGPAPPSSPRPPQCLPPSDGTDTTAQKTRETTTPVDKQATLQRNGHSSPRGPFPDSSSIQNISDRMRRRYRESYLNNMLAASWRAGEAWAGTDLRGLELCSDSCRAHEAVFRKVLAEIASAIGEAGCEAMGRMAEDEWQQLRSLRHRCLLRSTHTQEGSPMNVVRTPRSILKRTFTTRPQFPSST
eukprot:jgi/Botrbrau1/6400/Bobra.49_1s0017.2